LAPVTATHSKIVSEPEGVALKFVGVLQSQFGFSTMVIFSLVVFFFWGGH
jgi:hypothetical protein